MLPGLDLTYEELKQSWKTRYKWSRDGLDLTYEELKLDQVTGYKISDFKFRSYL